MNRERRHETWPARALRDALRIVVCLLALLSAGAMRPSIAHAQWIASAVLDAPEPLRVWFEERYLGTTPCRVDSLRPGAGELVLSPAHAPLDRWAEPWRERVELHAGEVDSLLLPRLGLVTVTATRGSAEVRLGERVMGRTPLRAYMPRDRGLELIMRSSQGTEERRSVRFESGDSLALVVDLPEPATKDVTRLSPPRTGWRQRAQVALPVAALAAGAVGVWARHQADNSYDDYLRGIDRAQLRDDLSRADHWDRVAVSCWIGAETCLAVAAWAWLAPDGSRVLQASIGREQELKLGINLGSLVP